MRCVDHYRGHNHVPLRRFLHRMMNDDVAASLVLGGLNRLSLSNLNGLRLLIRRRMMAQCVVSGTFSTCFHLACLHKMIVTKAI